MPLRAWHSGAAGKGNRRCCQAAIVISEGLGCPTPPYPPPRPPLLLKDSGPGDGVRGRVAFRPTGPLCAALNYH